jgi:hypothetical protein
MQPRAIGLGKMVEPVLQENTVPWLLAIGKKASKDQDSQIFLRSLEFQRKK